MPNAFFKQRFFSLLPSPRNVSPRYPTLNHESCVRWPAPTQGVFGLFAMLAILCFFSMLAWVILSSMGRFVNLFVLGFFNKCFASILTLLRSNHPILISLSLRCWRHFGAVLGHGVHIFFMLSAYASRTLLVLGRQLPICEGDPNLPFGNARPSPWGMALYMLMGFSYGELRSYFFSVGKGHTVRLKWGFCSRLSWGGKSTFALTLFSVGHRFCCPLVKVWG